MDSGTFIIDEGVCLFCLSIRGGRHKVFDTHVPVDVAGGRDNPRKPTFSNYHCSSAPVRIGKQEVSGGIKNLAMARCSNGIDVVTLQNPWEKFRATLIKGTLKPLPESLLWKKTFPMGAHSFGNIYDVGNTQSLVPQRACE